MRVPAQRRRTERVQSYSKIKNSLKDDSFKYAHTGPPQWKLIDLLKYKYLQNLRSTTRIPNLQPNLILSTTNVHAAFSKRLLNSAAMTSSPDKKEISIPRLGLDNKVRTVERLIIFALRYCGCSFVNMPEALVQYGFNKDTESIAAFAKANKIILHSEELSHPEQGRFVHIVNTCGAPTTVAIDYQDGFPVAMDITCSDLPGVYSWVDGPVGILTLDRRIISTDVSARRIVCWIPAAVPRPA